MFAALVSMVEGLEVPGHVDAVREVFRLRDRLNAALVTGLAELDRVGDWQVEGATSLLAWLRSNAGVSSVEAHRLSKLARRVFQLPDTFEAWSSGRLSGGQVEVIVANLSDATVELFAEQEAVLVPFLAPLDLAATTAAMQLWRQRAEALIDQRDGAELRRSLHLSRTLDGRGVLSGSFDAAAAAVIERAVEAAMVWDGAEETRSPAQQRADALVAVCGGWLDLQDTVPKRRNRPHVEIVIPAAELATGRSAATLDGLLLDPATVKQWLCDCEFSRVLVDADGVVLDYGRDRRLVSDGLFRAVRHRDRHCRWPGCDRKPSWCEAHHLWSWEDGGPTAIDNLALFCNRHHHHLHQPGVHAKLLPDAQLIVTLADDTPITSRPPPPTG